MRVVQVCVVSFLVMTLVACGKNQKSAEELQLSASKQGGVVGVLSHNPEPITITRYVINNREGIEGCDSAVPLSPDHAAPDHMFWHTMELPKTLQTGDSVELEYVVGGGPDCGNSLVQLDLETDQGKVTFTWEE